MNERGNPSVDPDDLWLSAAPLRGWKVARPCFERGAAVFAGVTSELTYGTDDVARCHHRPEHVPPAPHCFCGFYAWRHRQLATPLLWATRPALVAVDLFGRFDEYDLGFVAAGQRIGGVHLLPECSHCLMRGRREDAVVLEASQGGRSWVLPSCERHASPRATDPAVLSRRLGVEVSWLPMTPALDFHLALAEQLSELPVRFLMGTVNDLTPGEIGFVFQDHLRAGPEGLRIRSATTLIQPMPGTDVPIRRRTDGTLEVLVEGIRVPASGWKQSRDAGTVPVLQVGQPVLMGAHQEVIIDVR